jgi:hypothetical protein
VDCHYWQYMIVIQLVVNTNTYMKFNSLHTDLNCFVFVYFYLF